ncbi:carbon storage regulator CsrA [Singulisphaera acidiphila]|uniref:Translational regulator CsrA n=1 Tax=Singulisphaera acidiphila (strain ATCC BAA-1392 / DSM 18658 / VKM B-2454 / MOB10) TaxID=886293 RepID=L0DDB1_SINAD|nr:carbon storage regulator CsrA [Singulisphaera acidiphila]AGA26840.1 carbon storage regulator CsrA [Singulisphaera acidiphila DSM 18658]
MLVLSRKLNEAIMIDGAIRVTVVGIRHNQVRLGFEAPNRVGIYREELCAPIRSKEELAELPTMATPASPPAQPGRSPENFMKPIVAMPTE